MLLLVAEDRHAEAGLRRAIASARAGGTAAIVLTGDALLAMRLRREGTDARLPFELVPLEARRETFQTRDAEALAGVARAFGDRAAARGSRFGPYLQYTLIPAFIRAVRNVSAIGDLLAVAAAEAPSAELRLTLVGGGPLVDAARLVASRRGIGTETIDGDIFTRTRQAVARISAGRATRWVNTDLRALLLEPGFIWLLFLKGLWRSVSGSPPPTTARGAILVVGDRFTADVIERLQDQSRPLVVAGATQPGRALLDARMSSAGGAAAQARPIEAFTELADPLRWIGAFADAIADAIGLAGDEVHSRQFVVAGIPYWPLVGRTAWLHIVAWIPALRHLQTLTARAARACPEAHLLTSTDVTAYNRLLIDTARAFGIASTGIQHGITGESNGHSVVHVDTLMTWGAATEPWYRAHASQTAAFVVTGNPRFDALANRPAPRPPLVGDSPSCGEPVRRAEGAKADRPQPLFTVSVCTGFLSDFSVGASEYENLLMLDTVLAWARAHEGVRVIHKMHPGEEARYYIEAAQALGWDARMLTTIREPILYDVLEQSDVLVAAYSTTVLESVALGTPAIVCDAIVQRRLLPLDEIPGIAIAYTVDDLERRLDASRIGGRPDRTTLRRSPQLHAYISELDGQATARAAALLSTRP
jgi:hypothetical protein